MPTWIPIVLKVGKWLGLAAALAILAFWIGGLLTAKQNLHALEAEHEILLETVRLESEHHTYQMEECSRAMAAADAALDELAVRNEIYQDRLLKVNKTNNRLSEQLAKTTKELNEEYLGGTCEEQAQWVIAHAETLSKW